MISPSSTPTPSALSLCHCLPPLIKLALAVVTLMVLVTIPVEHWPAYGVIGCVVFAGHSLAGIPLRYLWKRLAMFLPLVLMMAVSLPLSQGLQRGWDLALTILFRGTLAFLVSLWLINVMPVEQLLVTLRRLRVPLVLVAILSFMHRYVFVVWQELDTLRTAHRSRSFGRTSLWFRWKTLASLIGMLLVRSLNRAEQIHRAMLARGWDGEVRRLDESQ